MINLIFAMDQNWLIGLDNKLPWHYPKDLKYFKQITHQKDVLMGHNTYLSLKGYYQNRPLPFKTIYVCNLNDYTYSDGILVKDLKTFLTSFKSELFIIGGGIIYEASLPYADRLYVTHVLDTHQGNVYFPQFELSKYRLIEKRLEPSLIFAVYERVDLA